MSRFVCLSSSGNCCAGIWRDSEEKEVSLGMGIQEVRKARGGLKGKG